MKTRSLAVCLRVCCGDRLGLKFCINRRSAVFLADFPTGGVARALRALGASEKGPQGPLQPTWLQISNEEDWAAWEARICDLPSHPPGQLLAFEVVYMALSDDSKVRWLRRSFSFSANRRTQSYI